MPRKKGGVRDYIRRKLKAGEPLEPNKVLAARFNTTPGYIQSAKYQIRKEVGIKPGTTPATKKKVTANITDNTATLESYSGRIRNAQELIDAVGIDMAGWVIDRKTVNKWEIGARGPDGEILVEPLFQVKLFLKLSQEKTVMAQIKADTLKDFQKYRPKSFKAKPVKKRTGYRQFIFLPDLHFGKLAIKSISNDEYNMDIAEKRAKAALADLLHRGSPCDPETVYLVFNGDTCHIDGFTNTTTKGTPQDTDGLYPDIFRRTWKIIADMASYAAESAKVHIVFIRGNHDWRSAIAIQEILSAYFRAHPNITVDNSMLPRRYFHFGINLVGVGHGDLIKPRQIALSMPQEVPEFWGKSKQRTFFTGHFHTSREEKYTPMYTEGGVRVVTVPSLSGTDKWHYEQGYLGTPAAQSYIFSASDGFIQMLNSPVLK